MRTYPIEMRTAPLPVSAGGHDWHGQTVTDRRCWCGARWTLEGVTVSHGIKPWGRCPVDQVATLRCQYPNSDRTYLHRMPAVSTNPDVQVLALGDIYFRTPMQGVERREELADAIAVEEGIGYIVFRNVLEAYIEARARRDRFGAAPIHRDPATGRILVGELSSLMSWRWDDGGWQPMRYEELEQQGSDATLPNQVCAEIRAALRRRSGQSWSVTHDRGTAYGWITIDAPPVRRTFTWDGTSPATDGCGYSSVADRQDLLKLLGLEGEHFHPQGLSLGADVQGHLMYVDRAHGRVPRLQELR